MSKKIKALIFDVGGVLQLGKYSKPKRGHRTIGVHQHMVDKLKISMDDYFDSLDTAYADSIEGIISRSEALKIIAANLKISVKKLTNLFIKSYKEHFTLNRELINISKKIKKKGYKVAIFSDQWYLSDEALVTKQMERVFKPILISCREGLRKPNPKFYKLLLNKLRIPAKQTVFIDNREWNLKPADKLGMMTLLFKNNKQMLKDLKKLGIEP